MRRSQLLIIGGGVRAVLLAFGAYTRIGAIRRGTAGATVTRGVAVQLPCFMLVRMLACSSRGQRRAQWNSSESGG
jgi:hypothetical protein